MRQVRTTDDIDRLRQDMGEFNEVMGEVCSVYRRVLELGANEGVEYGIGITPPRGELHIVVRWVNKRT
jgi:hypothetical protein